jgi:hypothetical protein
MNISDYVIALDKECEFVQGIGDRGTVELIVCHYHLDDR